MIPDHLPAEPYGICRIPVVLESFWAPNGLGQVLGQIKPLSGSRWQVQALVLGVADQEFQDRLDLEVFAEVHQKVLSIYPEALGQPCGPVLRYRHYRYVLIVPSELLDRDFVLFDWEFDNLRSLYHDDRENPPGRRPPGNPSPTIPSGT